MIELQHLIAGGVAPTAARTFLPHLQTLLPVWQINTKQRIAGFLAQAIHESSKFTALEENLYYSSPERLCKIFSVFRSPLEAAEYCRNPKKLANKVYANRGGNTRPDDGWTFRGRGIFQITLFNNYLLAAQNTGQPYVEHPDWVAQPEHAVLTACEYWKRTNCNASIDNGDIDGTTRKINGAAMLGRAERALNFQHLLAVL